MAFLYSNSYTSNRCSCLVGNIYQRMDGFAFCKEIVNNEYVICRRQIGDRDKHFILLLMGKGIGLRHILAVTAIERLSLLSKDNWHIEVMREHRGNGNTTAFDGEYLGHLNTGKSTLELLTYKSYDIHLKLMVEETVNLQNIAWHDNTLIQNLLF